MQNQTIQQEQQPDNDEITVKEHDFIIWFEDKTTKAVFKYLEHALEQNKDNLHSRSYIEDGINGQLKLNYYLGKEDAYNDLMYIRNLIAEKEVDDE